LSATGTEYLRRFAQLDALMPGAYQLADLFEIVKGAIVLVNGPTPIRSQLIFIDGERQTVLFVGPSSNSPVLPRCVARLHKRSVAQRSSRKPSIGS
jgi:hypothetical protein